MTRPKRTAALLAVAVLLALPTPAPAVTFMVNGNTPSQRWQAIIERAYIPTPDIVVALKFAPCPTQFVEGAALGCVSLSSHTIWLTPDSPSVMRFAIRHEVGHLFDATNLTDADRGAFQRIWHRPSALGWWDELAPYDPAALSLAVGATGEPSAAAEWFADAYGWCASHRIRDWKRYPLVLEDALDLRFFSDVFGPEFQRDDDRALATAYQRLADSCRLIWLVGERSA